MGVESYTNAKNRNQSQKKRKKYLGYVSGSRYSANRTIPSAQKRAADRQRWGSMMVSQNRKIREILKRTLVPKLEAEGFRGKFPEFQRIESGDLHLLSIQFDKYGGGFFLEFTSHPPGDLQTSWGENVPEQEITVAHTPIESRGRLQQKENKNSVSEDWFRFEKLSEDELEKLVQQVVNLLPQINDWLREKRVGINISTT